MKKLIEIYKDGWIKLGRYLAFSICLAIASIPGQIVTSIFAPKEEWAFSEYPLISVGLLLFFLFTFFFRIACW